MLVWLAILTGAVIIGIVCALLLSERLALFFGAALPWLGLLAFLLYHEYVAPYSGGGASLWPIAQFFAGTLAAGVGLAAAALTQVITARYSRREQ